MPIYEYLCPKGHRSEVITLSIKDSSSKVECPQCSSTASKIPSRPQFRLSWVPQVCDDVRDIWEGTPLEGTDGVNHLQYKSDKPFIDLSNA